LLSHKFLATLILVLMLAQVVLPVLKVFATIDTPIDTVTANDATAYSNGRKIVKLSNDTLVSVYTTGGSPQIYSASSNDGGITWIYIHKLSTKTGMSLYTNWQPAIAVDSSDNIFVVFAGLATEPLVTNEQIYFTEYTSGAWTAPVRISTNAGMEYNNQNRPSIAVSSTNIVYLVWDGANDGTGIDKIWFTFLSAGVWETPAYISTGAGMVGNPQDVASVEVDGNNNVHVIWTGISAGNPSAEGINYSEYSTGSWSTPVVISTYAGMDLYNQSPGSIAFDSNNYIYVVFYGKATGFTTAEQVWFSANTGGGWSDPVRISTYAGMSTNAQLSPTIAVDSSNTLYVIWYGAATSLNLCVWLNTKPTNNGWGTPAPIKTDGIVNYPSIRWSEWPTTNGMTSSIDYVCTTTSPLKVNYGSVAITGIYAKYFPNIATTLIKDSDSLPDGNNRDSFTAANLNWYFMVNQFNDLVFQTRPIGDPNWSDYTILVPIAGPTPFTFDVRYDITTNKIILVYIDNINYSGCIEYRTGVPNFDGTITWDNPYQQVLSNAGINNIQAVSVCRIEVTPSNYYDVVLYDVYDSSGTGTDTITAARNTLNNGVWSGGAVYTVLATITGTTAAGHDKLTAVAEGVNTFLGIWQNPLTTRLNSEEWDNNNGWHNSQILGYNIRANAWSVGAAETDPSGKSYLTFGYKNANHVDVYADTYDSGWGSATLIDDMGVSVDFGAMPTISINGQTLEKTILYQDPFNGNLYYSSTISGVYQTPIQIGNLPTTGDFPTFLQLDEVADVYNSGFYALDYNQAGLSTVYSFMLTGGLAQGIINGGFENDLAWSAGVDYSTQYAHTGLRSGFTYSNFYSQPLNIDVNTVQGNLNFWLLRNDAGFATITVTITYNDASTQVQTFSVTDSPKTWGHYTFPDFTPGLIITQIEFNGNNNNPVWVDDVSLFYIQSITTYDIEASVGSGSGTISPSGSIPVTPGANQGFTITASPGYSISDVVVDGVSVGVVSSYLFTNVNEAHTIVASFTSQGFTATASISNMDDTSNCYATKRYYNFIVTVHDPTGINSVTDIYLRGVLSGSTQFEIRGTNLNTAPTFTIFTGTTLITLNGPQCSWGKNGDTGTLTLAIRFEWLYPQAMGNDISVKVISTGSGTLGFLTLQSNYFNVITRIITSNFVGNCTYVPVNFPVRLTGYVKYALTTSSNLPSTLSPPDSEFTAIEIEDASDVTVGSGSPKNGFFNITFNAPASVQVNTYHVFFHLAADGTVSFTTETTCYSSTSYTTTLTTTTIETTPTTLTTTTYLVTSTDIEGTTITSLDTNLVTTSTASSYSAYTINYNDMVEVDPNNRLTINSPTSISIVYHRQNHMYLYQDYGANWFTGDYTIYDTVRLDNAGAYASVYIMMCGVSNIIGGLESLTSYQGAVFRFDGGSAYTLSLNDVGGAGGTGYSISPNVYYYLTMQRTGTTLTLKIYSDSSRTVLLTTLTRTGCQTTAWEYLYGCAGQYYASSDGVLGATGGVESALGTGWQTWSTTTIETTTPTSTTCATTSVTFSVTTTTKTTTTTTITYTTSCITETTTSANACTTDVTPVTTNTETTTQLTSTTLTTTTTDSLTLSSLTTETILTSSTGLPYGAVSRDDPSGNVVVIITIDAQLSMSFDDEVGLTAKDSSTKGNNGVIALTVKRTGFGYYGRGLSFNGIGNVTVTDSPSLDITTNIYLSAWIKSNNTGVQGIITKQGCYGLELLSNHGLRMTIDAVNIDSVSNVTNKNWCYVAGAYDGSNVYLYVNGTLILTQPTIGSINTNANPVYIGASVTTSSHFSGLLDEVRILDYVPVGTQTVTIRFQPISPFPYNLVSSITDMNAGNWVFSGQSYHFLGTFVRQNSSYPLNFMAVIFSDGVSFTTLSFNRVSNTGLVTSNYANKVQVTNSTEGNDYNMDWETYVAENVQDALGVDLYMYCNTTIAGQHDGIELNQLNYFNIYNYGGLTETQTAGDGQVIPGNTVWELEAKNSTLGSYARENVTWRNFQHVNILVHIFQNTTNGYPGDDIWYCPTEHNNTGYIEYGVDYWTKGAWIEGWKVHIEVAKGDAGEHLTSPNQAWVLLDVSWYNRGVLVKTDQIYAYYEAISHTDTTTQFALHIDLWIGGEEGSSIAAGRVNAEYYGMQEGGWGPFSSWSPIKGLSDDSLFKDDLLDKNSNIIGVNDIQLFKVWAKVAKIAKGGGATNCDSHQWRLINYDSLGFQTLPAKVGANVGIDTPVYTPTVQPTMSNGFLTALMLMMTEGVMKPLLQALLSAGTTSFFAVVAIINQAFSVFGIKDFVATVQGMITAFATYFTYSVTNIIAIIQAIMSMITFIFGSIFYWFVAMINLFLYIFNFMRLLVNGGSQSVYGVSTGLGDLWVTLNVAVWIGIVPIFILIWWFDSLEDRTRRSGMGFLYVLINDIQIITWVIGYITDILFRVLNFVIDMVFRIMYALRLGAPI